MSLSELGNKKRKKSKSLPFDATQSVLFSVSNEEEKEQTFFFTFCFVSFLYQKKKSFPCFILAPPIREKEKGLKRESE